MKNSIKKLVLLCIFLIAISYAVITYMGKTYTIVFDLNNANDYKLLVEELVMHLKMGYN